MSISKQDIKDTFLKYYEITKNDLDKMPTQIVFSRIAEELDMSFINPCEIGWLIADLELIKKPVCFSNGSNSFINSLSGGKYKTITMKMKNDFIENYRDKSRLTINTFIGVRERLEKNIETSNFDKTKIELIQLISETTNKDDLIKKIKNFIQILETPEQNSELIDTYKSKKITINKQPTVIKFGI